jgi:hypothetical protein
LNLEQFKRLRERRPSTFQLFNPSTFSDLGALCGFARGTAI